MRATVTVVDGAIWHGQLAGVRYGRAADAADLPSPTIRMRRISAIGYTGKARDDGMLPVGAGSIGPWLSMLRALSVG